MYDLHTHRCPCRPCKVHREIERLEGLEYSALPRIEDVDSLPDDLGGCLYGKNSRCVTFTCSYHQYSSSEADL